jgi:transposase
MIQITPQMRILLAVAPVDFRRGIDGLAQVCRAALQVDPLSGAVVVFRNRRGTALKVLVYDGQGFWLCQKRLSTARLKRINCSCCCGMATRITRGPRPRGAGSARPRSDRARRADAPTPARGACVPPRPLVGSRLWTCCSPIAVA